MMPTPPELPATLTGDPKQTAEQATQTVLRLAEALAALHRLSPAVALASAPRDDVRALAQAWDRLLARAPSVPAPHRELLAACLADQDGPADACELARRLNEVLRPPPPPVPAPAAAGGASAKVRRMLGALQAPEPESPKWVVNSLGMKFVRVPAGTFKMGSPASELGRRDNEGPQHEVSFPKELYLGVYLVTQGQYEKVTGTSPSRFKLSAGGGPEHPVECVSWDDAIAFLRKLGELPAEKEAGRLYRLPTEAEWEHACRAGAKEPQPFSFGSSLSSHQANFDGSHPYGGAGRGPALPRTSPVGSYEPNGWGLYDMHGNVWEWCIDWFGDDYYQQSPRQWPTGPLAGQYRVLRGGSWRNQAVTCRSAYRNALAANQRQPFIGFRAALTVAAVGSQR